MHDQAKRDAAAVAAQLGVSVDFGPAELTVSRVLSRTQGAIARSMKSGGRKPHVDSCHEWVTDASGYEDGWLT
jgi:hypothetical protein